MNAMLSALKGAGLVTRVWVEAGGKKVMKDLGDWSPTYPRPKVDESSQLVGYVYDVPKEDVPAIKSLLREQRIPCH